MIRSLNDTVLIGGQIRPEEVRDLRQLGVAMIVNNRPDGEEPGQPLAAEIEEAAAAAGIAYRFVPIIRGIGPGDVEAMGEAIRDAGEGKILAFCRSGARSALAAGLAMRERGTSAEDVERCLVGAGFDAAPIAHLL